MKANRRMFWLVEVTKCAVLVGPCARFGFRADTQFGLRNSDVAPVVIPGGEARVDSQTSQGTVVQLSGEALFSAMPAPGEPSSLIADPVELILGYLDFFEDVTLRKISGLRDDQLRASSVPSGWSPLGLIKHLACTERFWVRHVFLGESVDFSWPGDAVAEWRVEGSDSAESITQFYRYERGHTRRALAGMPASTPAKRSFRPGGGDPPTLGWVACHLMYQAARHAGHLDIAREMTDGAVGSD
jgi:hypothetical protein